MSIKTTIVDLQQYAAKKRWILISTTYKNNHTHMEWECENKHKWLAIWHNIKDKNQGCPVCNGKAKPEVKELQTHAISKGGKLISSTYINNRTLMEWQCSKGHVWKAAWAQIKSRGDWCPACAGKEPY